jgi:hypothetical protein
MMPVVDSYAASSFVTACDAGTHNLRKYVEVKQGINHLRLSKEGL